MTRDTIQDAERVACSYATQQRPCEVVVCDAYHRVLRRELVPDVGEVIASGQGTADARANGSGAA